MKSIKSYRLYQIIAYNVKLFKSYSRNFIIGLFPYNFTKYRWFRKVIYNYTSYYKPIDIDWLNDDLDDYSNGEINIYEWYKAIHVISKKEYQEKYLGIKGTNEII